MGIEARLDFSISSTLLFSLFARASSSCLVRAVDTRPGSTRLTVMPSGATSRAKVFDHPAKAERSAFEMHRFGIGATTPEDALVMIRPQRFARKPGSTRSVMWIIDRTIE